MVAGRCCHQFQKVAMQSLVRFGPGAVHQAAWDSIAEV